MNMAEQVACSQLQCDKNYRPHIPLPLSKPRHILHQVFQGVPKITKAFSLRPRNLPASETVDPPSKTTTTGLIHPTKAHMGRYDSM